MNQGEKNGFMQLVSTLSNLVFRTIYLCINFFILVGEGTKFILFLPFRVIFFIVDMVGIAIVYIVQGSIGFLRSSAYKAYDYLFKNPKNPLDRFGKLRHAKMPHIKIESPIKKEHLPVFNRP